MGNICRSPTAEGVFNALLKKRGVSDAFEVDSAGTYGGHAGRAPDTRMTRAAALRGYALTGKARQVTGDDFTRYDLMIAMDGQNIEDLTRLATLTGNTMQRVRLLCSFLPGFDASNAPPVPDPYHGGDAGFERVLDMIEEACPAILEHLQSP